MLITGADVLLQNLPPAPRTAWPQPRGALEAGPPKIPVVCDISGYGESGPMVRKKAYDLLIQAESGLISVTGSPTSLLAGISIADIATGMAACLHGRRCCCAARGLTALPTSRSR